MLRRNGSEIMGRQLLCCCYSKGFQNLSFFYSSYRNLATYHLKIDVQKRLNINSRVHFNSLPSDNSSTLFRLVVARYFGNLTLWLRILRKRVKTYIMGGCQCLCHNYLIALTTCIRFFWNELEH